MICLKYFNMLLLAVLAGSTTANAQSPIVENNNTFTLDFYSQWTKQTDKNIVISPFSISAAVAMTYPGARNATATQMKTAMRFLDNREQQNREFHTLLTSLNATGSPMIISNTMWLQRGFKIEQEFTDVNTKYFGSGVRQVPFAESPDSARIQINTLIEKQTKEKIKNLLPAGSISPLTRLVLTNAIYFKDAWAAPFDLKKTKDRSFYVTPGKPVKTKFMEHQNSTFNFFENDLVTILELPYSSGRFSMLVLLPKGSLPTFEKSLTARAYKSWTFKPGTFRSVQLPRFKIDHDVQPGAILNRFGMTDAFQEGKADFSGISNDTKLFISGIFHKAFVEVNEEGTEAAAATAVIATTESAFEPEKKLDFIANKPFLFIIRDRTTNSIVFIGKVKNPVVGSAR